MRKIEEKMVNAISNHEQFTLDNTKVVSWSDNKVEIYLHDNLIVMIDNDQRKVTLSSCGWYTVTTKSRLNSIISDYLNIGRIFQKDFNWYIQLYNDDSVIDFYDRMVLNY